MILIVDDKQIVQRYVRVVGRLVHLDQPVQEREKVVSQVSASCLDDKTTNTRTLGFLSCSSGTVATIGCWWRRFPSFMFTITTITTTATITTTTAATIAATTTAAITKHVF